MPNKNPDCAPGGAGELIERAEAMWAIKDLRRSSSESYDAGYNNALGDTSNAIAALPTIQPAAVACGCRAVVEKMRNVWAEAALHNQSRPYGYNQLQSKTAAANEILAALPAPSVEGAIQELIDAARRALDRYDREDKGGLKVRDGLTWAMANDLRNALSALEKVGK